jgi:hypothetical protein
MFPFQYNYLLLRRSVSIPIPFSFILLHLPSLFFCFFEWLIHVFAGWLCLFGFNSILLLTLLLPNPYFKLMSCLLVIAISLRPCWCIKYVCLFNFNCLLVWCLFLLPCRCLPWLFYSIPIARSWLLSKVKRFHHKENRWPLLHFFFLFLHAF